jgi:CheY-like chemotaxis protein
MIYCIFIDNIFFLSNSLLMKTSYTILYADDDKEDLSIISEAFEKYTDNLRVSHAYNGVEALKFLAHMQNSSILPCLVILDINMPVMNGIETLREIKKVPEYSQIPVVMFSTSSNPADMKIAQSLGADYMIKPVRYEEMEKLVGQFVEKCFIESSS